jgi:hypothetical protein
LEASYLYKGQALGLVEIGQQVDIRGNRGFVASYGTEYTQVNNTGSAKFRLVVSQLLDDAPLVHISILCQCCTFLNKFEESQLVGYLRVLFFSDRIIVDTKMRFPRVREDANGF